MNCKGCKKPMAFVYDVVERETVFVLWECACGSKELERKPAAAGRTPVPAGAVAVAASATLSDDD